MNPVTLTHSLPGPSFEVVPADMVKNIQCYVAAAKDITEVNSANLEIANTAVVALHNSSKSLTNHVEGIKKPLNQLLKAVRDCAENAEAPLIEAKRDLQYKISAWNAAESRRIAEARRIAQEEAQRAQAEAMKAHAAKVAEGQRQAEADAKLIAELMGAPTEVKPTFIAPPPVIVAKPIIEEQKPSAVVMRKVKTLVITDAKLIPITVGGVEIRPVDETRLKALLLAGASVPGAEIQEREVAAMGRGL